MSYTNICWFLIFIVAKCVTSVAIYESDCPTDCICYLDYLSNLAPWKWIEGTGDRHVGLDDPKHEEFNPYIEHNEVYENPESKKYKNEDPLRTVTCILRNSSTDFLTKFFNQLDSQTQVLSLLQAPGSGNIIIEEKYFEKLRSIIGLQFQGYENTKTGFPTSLKIGPDALNYLDKLTYLSLENVIILERELQNKISDTDYVVTTIVRFTRSGNTTHVISNVLGADGNDNHLENDIQSQLMFLSPDEPNDQSNILPYNTYKQRKEMLSLEGKKHPTPLEPKVKVAFTGIDSLLQLRISECNLDGISWDMFYKLQHLMYLVLERNDLLYLPDFVFYATPNLTSLSLADNRILSLQTVGLAGLLQLQKLDVTSNNITYLSELSLPPFPHLEIADFRLNPIQTIFPNTFEVMNTTKTLYIGNPSVPLEFLANSFFGLNALIKLEIDNVRMEFLERPMLKGMPQLKILSMNGQIKRISYDAFNEVPKLEKLTLKQCSIKKISMDAFYGLTSLLELDLSYNLLTFLPPGLLDDQIQLQEVYLHHNQLVTLPQLLFSRSPLRVIRLDENKWHCSCDMTTWNSRIINQVKRYGIVKNETLCQRQYDKGSMCRSEHVKLQAKYVYEKRVSPVCTTPSKFYQRSVFEVVRREFKYCNQSTNNTEPETLLIEGEVKDGKVMLKAASKYKIVKTKERMEKQKEKDLYFARLTPTKIKKPANSSTTTPPFQLTTTSLPIQSSSSNLNNFQETTRSSNMVEEETSTYSIRDTTFTSTATIETSTTTPTSTVQMFGTEPPENVLPTISTKPSTPNQPTEESAEILHYNRILPFRLTREDEQHISRTPKWPFQTKSKIAPKHPKQLKIGSTKPASVLSKNALKLARIQRRMERRL